MKRLLIASALLVFAAAPSVAMPPRSGAAVLPSTPMISPSGSVTVGTVLTVPSYTGATYQWKRNGATISGQTGTSYTTVSTDFNKTITVDVTLAGVTVTSGGVTVGSLWFNYPSQSGYLTLIR